MRVDEKGAVCLNTAPITSQKSQGGKRLVGPEDLEAFREAVSGSDLTKAGLIEVLKKRYVHQMFLSFMKIPIN